MDISNALFWNAPRRAGVPAFTYAELLAQLQQDISGGGSPFAGQGALVSRIGSQVISNSISASIVWDTAEYDDLGFTDIGGATPQRLTIPVTDPVIERVIIGGRVEWSVAGGGIVQLTQLQNFTNFPSAAFPGGVFELDDSAAGTLENRQSISSAPISVVPGDFFEHQVLQNSGGVRNVINSTMFIFVVR